MFFVFGEFEESFEFDVIDAEDFALVGLFGFGHDFEEPRGGGHGFVVVQGNALFGADEEKGVAGNGIEGWMRPLRRTGSWEKARILNSEVSRGVRKVERIQAARRSVTPQGIQRVQPVTVFFMGWRVSAF